MPYDTGICHYVFIKTKVLSIALLFVFYLVFFFSFFLLLLYISGINKLDEMVDHTTLDTILRKAILKGLTLRKFVFDVCIYVLFYICVGIDFVDLTVKGKGFT